MSKHTPGPWRVAGDFAVIDVECERQVADTWYCSRKTSIANAKLVARAPELLARVEFLEREIRKQIESDEDSITDCAEQNDRLGMECYTASMDAFKELERDYAMQFEDWKGGCA